MSFNRNHCPSWVDSRLKKAGSRMVLSSRARDLCWMTPRHNVQALRWVAQSGERSSDGSRSRTTEQSEGQLYLRSILASVLFLLLFISHPVSPIGTIASA
ncbi:hypothetical protein T439DRAFT_123268 [Meredithblackwellia eburnea MCA 4105]